MHVLKVWSIKASLKKRSPLLAHKIPSRPAQLTQQAPQRLLLTSFGFVLEPRKERSVRSSLGSTNSAPAGKPQQNLPEKLATAFVFVALLGQRLGALSRIKNGLLAALCNGERLSFFYLVADLVLSLHSCCSYKLCRRCCREDGRPQHH